MNAADFPLRLKWVPALNEVAVWHEAEGQTRRLLLRDWLVFRCRQKLRRAMNGKGGAR